MQNLFMGDVARLQTLSHAEVALIYLGYIPLYHCDVV